MKTRILFLVLALTLLSVQVLAQQPDQPQNPPQEGNFIERFFTKEVHQHAEEFYKYVETFFLDYFLPGYYHVKKSMLLTSAAIMILSLFFIRFLASLFGGSGRSGKKFRYNKEEPISYSDLNQHFRNFTKELADLKQQVSKAPEGGAGEEGQQAGGPSALPDFEKFTKSLSKTEDHLTKLYQENKQLNQFLGNFQKEILESHKEIWRELHALKTAPRSSAASGSKSRGVSVSASDERTSSRRTQDALQRSAASSESSKPAEPVHQARPAETSANVSDTRQPRSQEPQEPVGFKAQDQHSLNDSTVSHSTEHSKGQTADSTNPFAANGADNKLPGPGLNGKPAVVKRGGMPTPTARHLAPGGGPHHIPPVTGGRQPPTMTTNSDTSANTAPKDDELLNAVTPATLVPEKSNTSTKSHDHSVTKDTDTDTPTTQSNQQSLTLSEEHKATTEPEADHSKPATGGPFGGLHPTMGKKPTPVVRNNFPIPQKRNVPAPNPFGKKPPMTNPSTGAGQAGEATGPSI